MRKQRKQENSKGYTQTGSPLRVQQYHLESSYLVLVNNYSTAGATAEVLLHTVSILYVACKQSFLKDQIS